MSKANETEVTVEVPKAWQEHISEVEAEISRINQTMTNLQAQMWVLQQQKEELVKHLALSVIPIARNESPDLSGEFSGNWSPNRKTITGIDPKKLNSKEKQ